MWKASAGTTIISKNDDDEDWETDPDFINNVTEQEQRWGSKTIEGSGRTAGAIEYTFSLHLQLLFVCVFECKYTQINISFFDAV